VPAEGLPPQGPEPVSALLTEAFGVSGYVQGFPHVFSTDNAHNVFLFREGGKDAVGGEVRAVCAGWEVAWPTGDAHVGLVRGFCVGSVATARGFEGRGYASAVLACAIDAARVRGIDAICLFSEKKRLYEKAGFVSAGGDAFVFLHPLASAASGAANNAVLVARHATLVKTGFGRTRIFCSVPASEAPLEKLAQAILDFSARCAPTLSRLDAKELRTLLSIPDMQLRWLESDGAMRALCFVGKGHDFQGVMHGLLATSWDDAVYLLGESWRNAPDETVTLLVESFARECARFFTVEKSDAVSFLYKCLGNCDRPARISDLFRAKRLRVRGLQSC